MTAMPAPSIVENAGGKTLVTNAGSNGKFLGVLDLDVKGGHVADFRYRLLPVFANLLPADAEMEALIAKTRAPYESKLGEKLAVSEGLLYRRGNFNGSFDQLILDALIAEKDAEIAFSPGFRWGTTILPGEPITMENLLDQTAITYPYVTSTQMNGSQIKQILEDVVRQSVQRRSLLSAGRRHGARRRHELFLRSDRDDGQSHRRHEPQRQADRR